MWDQSNLERRLRRFNLLPTRARSRSDARTGGRRREREERLQIPIPNALGVGVGMSQPGAEREGALGAEFRIGWSRCG